MRGSPLLRALCAFVLIALTGIPLWKLTRVNAAVAAPVQAEAANVEVAMRLHFSAAPEKFEVLHLGKSVWTGTTRETEAAKTVRLAFPKEGVDLQFRVTWPANETDSALRVQLTDPDGNEHDRTVWGRGELDEVITFP
jgi:hypothetical protein